MWCKRVVNLHSTCRHVAGHRIISVWDITRVEVVLLKELSRFEILFGSNRTEPLASSLVPPSQHLKGTVLFINVI